HHTDVEFVGEDSLDARLGKPLAALGHYAAFGKNIRNPKETFAASAEFLEYPSNDRCLLEVRHDVLEMLVVNVTDRRISWPPASQQFFPDATLHVALVMDDEVSGSP